jgi:hypothetical protein
MKIAAKPQHVGAETQEMEAVHEATDGARAGPWEGARQRVITLQEPRKLLTRVLLEFFVAVKGCNGPEAGEQVQRVAHLGQGQGGRRGRAEGG